MINLLTTLTQFLKSSLVGEPAAPAILNGLDTKLESLLALTSDPSGTGIGRWLAKLHDITRDTRLQETLLVRTLQMNFPRAAEFLTLLGIIKFEWANSDISKPVAFSINWNEYNHFVKNPGDEALNLFLSKVNGVNDIGALKVLLLLLFSSSIELLNLEYRGQGFSRLPLDTSGVDSDELLNLIENMVHSPLSLPLPFTPPITLENFKNLTKIKGTLGELIINGPSGLEPFDKLSGFSVALNLKKPNEFKPLDIGDNWLLNFESRESSENTSKIAFNKDSIDTAALSQSQLTLFLTKKPADRNALLIGKEDGTHFSIQTIVIGLELNDTLPAFNVKCKFGEIEFALKPDFLKFLSFGLNLPEQLLFQSDFELNYVQGKGLNSRGRVDASLSLAVEFATPLNLKLGVSGAGIDVDNVVTRLEVKSQSDDFSFRISFMYGANAEFGPLKIVLDGAGVWLGRWNNETGGLIAPKGIGVSLEAGPVKGGGFLEVINKNEFAGAFQLKILGIGAFAYCIYKKLPTGEISFVALIGIRLPPPGIQISFGFAVTGFGGLVGINRKADTDIIRERLSTGTAGDVLFNDDPMKNAPKLLGDMHHFFPDLIGGFIIGPTLQINWLYILTIDAGLYIQLPGPVIFIAGSAKLVLGSEEFALVNLRMDFVGGIDATKSLIFFDAALVNSSVLGIFRITGGVALRISYGENGYFLFSVGGFNPNFKPGSFELPKVPRVGVFYSAGPVWLKNEMYLAITSNTFQLGYKIEAGIHISIMSAHGWFSFDALIQFKPFYFIGNIDAGFDVEVKGFSLCNVRVEGKLSGPGPLVLQAKASVKVLLLKISKHITVQLNSNLAENIVPIPNVPQYLKDEGEIVKPDNLRAEGDDDSVILAPNIESIKLFSPVNSIIWEQKRVPMQLPIQRMEGVELGGFHNLAVVATLTGLNIEPEYDWFGVGTYLTLPDSEALNNAQFVKQQSGIRIGDVPLLAGESVDAFIELSLVKLPERTRFDQFPGANYLTAALATMLSERNVGSKMIGVKPQIKVVQEEWNFFTKDGMVENSSSLNSVQAFVSAKQNGGIALPVGEKQLDLTAIF